MNPAVIVIIVAVAVAIGVIIWGIVSVRSEKDIIEERLARIETANTSFLQIDETPEDKVVERKAACFKTASTQSFRSAIREKVASTVVAC